MSSIKKYVAGDTKEWITFGETNVLPNELSNANNISVDFGKCESVNSLLYSQQKDIESLKRNVSWLALHGGGGSGSGSGGGSTARKATCQITVNDSTREVPISEGSTLYVRLSNFKGSSTSVPWNIKIYFGEQKQSIYSGSKSQGESDTITVPISWSTISRFFEGTGKTQNHQLIVEATYKDDETQLEGSGYLQTFVYIPNIDVTITTRDQYKCDSGTQSELTASIEIKTAIKGKFKLKVESKSYDSSLVYDSFEFNKTQDEAFIIIENFMDAFKNDEGKIQLGIFESTFYLYNENSTTGSLQLMYQTTKQVIIYSNDVSLLVSFNGLSPNSDPKKRTEVFDNVKNLFFSFYAFKYGFSEYTYSIYLKDTTQESPLIDIVVDKIASFQTVVNVNKIIQEFKSGHFYTVILQITPTKPAGKMEEFNGYVKCVQGQYSFITYSSDGESNRLFELDTFNHILLNEGLKNEVEITSTTSVQGIIGGDNHPISANIMFYQINPRSGLIADNDNMKALRLYDTYMDIDNNFRYTQLDHGKPVITSTKIQDHKSFTIGICYQAQQYVSNDHIIFSLCENGFSNKGITIRTDGVYVKDQKVLAVYSGNIVTVHIVYNNESGETDRYWGEKSFYKIYVNGVITKIDTECPFQEYGPNKQIQNQNLKISINGISNDQSSSRQEQSNCNIYSIEILKGKINELDMLGSFINNRLRTNYKDYSPDFSIIEEERSKNCCSYDNNTHTLSSSIYPILSSSSSRKFIFDGTFLSSGEVPYTNDDDIKKQWIAKLSSLSLPITYIDIKGSSSPTLADWTFENFIIEGSPLKKSSIETKFYYWDPKSNQMPISAEAVELKLQGTSTLENHIKNVEITFNTHEVSGEIVRDLFFVKNDLIPENNYVLKADVVDSSHANNASIGKFINEQFSQGASFDFGFDEKKIAAKNISQTSRTLKDNQKWNINPTLKHTVEGFQTILLIRFAEGDFINLGIYSFNIGRKAARNLGFEYITAIKDINNEPISGAIAPSILKDVIVDVKNEDSIFWVENSNSQNFSGVSSWNTSTTSLTPYTREELSSTNPAYECRFWHCRQGSAEEDVKLNKLFEVKYYNTIEEKHPNDIETFVSFVKQISLLPVEGLLKTTELDYNLNQIIGSYVTYKYTDLSGLIKLSNPHSLNDDTLEDKDINSFEPTQLASYYVIALLFGLIDNLDKNISFRIFGNSRLMADFYDMDTAFGLDNLGNDNVSPAVGIKLISDYRNSSNQDFPYETYDKKNIIGIYEKYSKVLPETYTNKIWMSLDSNSMRAKTGLKRSLYSEQWFKLRQYLDQIAKTNGYVSIVDFFVEKYFKQQVNCGTLIYNYDYTIKYLNDYKQTGEKQDSNQISLLHGRRIDEVREWFKNHIDFLDTYFFWRGNNTYIGGTDVVPTGLETVINHRVKIASSAVNNFIGIETKYPVIVHSGASSAGPEVGNTLTFDNEPKNLRVPGGATGKMMQIDCSSLLKNFSMIDLAVSYFRSINDTKITFVEKLILDELNIIADGLSMKDFIDLTDQSVNPLHTISMKKTTFDNSFNLDLDVFQLLNVSYVDISKSKNINSLTFYKNDIDSTTQNLKYLNVSESQIENLTLRNQTYLVLPNVDTCNNLVTLTIQNCNLDNISGSRTALSNYTNIDLSAQNSIQKVDLQNVEHIKSIRINECPSFEELNLDGLSSLTSLTLDNNIRLNKINISKCPLLQSIDITQCKAFKDIEILSVNNLTSLNLEYDSSLSSIKISEDSVKSITSLNLRNVDITGFNFYNYETKTYDPIIKDPLGQEVLDFSKFLALDSSGITIRKQASGDLTSDKCYNFKAIRFRNTPSKSYTMLDRSGRDNIGVRFTNLKNIYGHISLTGNGEFANGTDWFLSAESTYTGYPPFVKTLAWSSNKVDMTVFKSKTFLDKIEEKCATLKPKLEGKSDLSQISSYISNGFIECGNDNFHEFDNREWATNYTVPTLDFLFEGRSLSEFKFQYLIYRYSINQMNNQINKTANDFHGFANYIPSDTADGQNIYFPDNTFRFIGNTLTDVRRIFSWSGTGKSSYIVTNDIMKWLTRIQIYAGIGNKEILFWNALSSSSSTLTSLGNIDDHVYFTSEAIAALSGEDDGSSYDYGPNFISTLTNLKQIISFSPSLTNFRISSLVFPSSLEVIGNSFTKTPADEVIDLSSMFQNCTNMSRIYYSFNNAQIMLKPSSFKMMPRLTQIAFNGTANKLLVEDRITLENYLSSYDENANRYYIRDEYEPEVSISCTDYTSNMFTEFVNTILTANSQLTSTDYLFANMSIPYRNIYEDDYYNKLSSKLSLNKNLFRNNTRIKSLQFFFQNAKFRYSVVSEMFSTLTALENMYCAFANTPSIAYGIESCIPYKFLYTGNIANKTINFEGSDRFENAPVSYPQFKTYVNNSFIPTTRTAGSKSYNWINLSTNINQTGLLNQTAFNDVKTTYLTGDTYVDLPTEMSNYSSYCPLATYENVDDQLSLHITPGGEPLFKTLSTIYRSLSSNVNTWKQHVCGISSTSLTHPQYRRTITNVNNLFEGNVNIKTYDGSIISEKNADFNPFILNYDSSRQLLTVNSIRNVFRDDDSWSSNGGIWKWSNDADNWVLDDHPVSGNYNANHFNSTTPDLSVLSSNSYEVKDLSGTGAQIIYSQVDQYKQAYFRDDTARNQLLVEYLLTKEQTQQFKYICSPDLFRYCIPGLQVLENVFANCDNFCNYSLMTFDADKKQMNVGLAGRIPPNLFRPFQGGLRSIARLFKNCYHITGYESINSKGERASYLIPAKLFEKNTLVYCFDEAFSGMTIKYNPDLITPFSCIMAGNSSNGTKISIGSTFSRCIWCNVNITIQNLFAQRWFSNINSTFYNILGTKTSSPNGGNINVRIAEAGATIGSIPTFKVFTSTRYVPQRVTSTYYGALDGTAGQIYKVDNSDVVRKTLTTTSTITPSA